MSERPFISKDTRLRLGESVDLVEMARYVLARDRACDEVGLDKACNCRVYRGTALGVPVFEYVEEMWGPMSFDNHQIVADLSMHARGCQVIADEEVTA